MKKILKIIGFIFYASCTLMNLLNTIAALLVFILWFVQDDVPMNPFFSFIIFIASAIVTFLFLVFAVGTYGEINEK